MAKKPSLPWTDEENQEFENCIARYGNLEESNLLVNLGRHFNGKRTFDEVMDHYLAFKNGQVPLPNYDSPNNPFVSSVSGAGCRNPVESSSSLAFGGVDGQGSTGAIATNAGGCNIVSKDNNGRSKWTIDDQKLFLVGLWKYGSRYRGKWVDISEHIVRSRTSRQISSHGNKYLEQLKKPVKSLNRTRHDTPLFDITVVDDKSLSDLVGKKLLSPADAEAYALHLKGNANPVPETGSSQRILNPDSDTLRGVTSCVNQTTTQNVQQEVEHIPSAAVIPHLSEPSRQAPYVHSDFQHLQQIFHVQQEIIDHQQPETVSSQRILNPESDTLRGVTSCVNQTTTQNPQMQISNPTHQFQPRAPQICHIQLEIQDSQNVVETGNTAEPELPLDNLDFLRQVFEDIPSAEVLPHSPNQPWQHIYSQLEQDLQQETRNSHTVSDNVQPPQLLPSMIIHEISDDDDDPDMPYLEPADTPNHSEESSESDFEAQVYKLFK